MSLLYAQNRLFSCWFSLYWLLRPAPFFVGVNPPGQHFAEAFRRPRNLMHEGRSNPASRKIKGTVPFSRSGCGAGPGQRVAGRHRDLPGPGNPQNRGALHLGGSLPPPLHRVIGEKKGDCPLFRTCGLKC